jgi:hypothetical protein
MKTKYLLLPVIAFLIVIDAFSQNRPETHTLFLFPDFISGNVFMKSGDTLQLMLNYNILTEKMLYIDKDKVWEIANPEKIESVIIAGRIFKPEKNVFLEMIPGNKYPLYIQHRLKVLPEPKQAGFGSTSETGSIMKYSSIVSSSGSHYNLNLNEPFRSELNLLFWLERGNKFYKANNIKQVCRFFPEKTSAIKEFVKTNRINFDNSADMVKLIDFCNQ